MNIRELSLEILKITNGAGWINLYDLEQGRLELLLKKEVKNCNLQNVIKDGGELLPRKHKKIENHKTKCTCGDCRLYRTIFGNDL